ncbi:Histidine phosphatase superfamily, clade-2 like protein [Aduncisulcus paluster]|uniref:Histidine phosphatase superfamily, clade-2 like protein n=1 Tax=Aduncisulcus paluster TaxID=2918883 RepID=A0ABQ5KI84_9EUKA|nr:Histidine phosphatase superfamily, clade-2 like protein [Aduncisulcus paluster]
MKATLLIICTIFAIYATKVHSFSSDDYFPIYSSYVLRHGDRTAIWPLDPSKDSSPVWDNMVGNRSAGQLTSTGVSMAYSKGQTFYNNIIDVDGNNSYALLPSTYNFSTIQFRATGYDRTLMTGYSFLSGIFYGDNSAPIPNNSSPVPIHAVLKTDDPLLRPYNTCPTLEDFQASIDDIPELWAEYEERKPILDEVSQKVGSECTGPSTVQSSLFDPLTCDRYHGYLPDNVTEDEYQVVKEMFYLVNQYKYSIEDPYYQLYSCNFLQELHDHIDSLFTDEYPTADAHFYFAHDSTIMAFRAGLGIPAYKVPEYVAHLGYEVLSKKSSPYRPSWVEDRVSSQGSNMKDFYIRFVFGDNSDSFDATPFSSPYIDAYVASLSDGDTETLPEGYYRLDHFMDYVSSSVWSSDKFDQVCGNVPSNEMDWYWGMLIGILASTVLLGVLILVLYCLRLRKSRASPVVGGEYSRVLTDAMTDIVGDPDLATTTLLE